MAFFQELQNEDFDIKKDYKKKKYDFKDMLLEILNKMRNKCNYFHEIKVKFGIKIKRFIRILK